MEANVKGKHAGVLNLLYGLSYRLKLMGNFLEGACFNPVVINALPADNVTTNLGFYPLTEHSQVNPSVQGTKFPSMDNSCGEHVKPKSIKLL